MRAITSRTAQVHELIITITSDLSDEQLNHRPADVSPSLAPSIAWHLWHITRWADVLQASLPGMAPELASALGPAQQIWKADRVAARWGLAPPAIETRARVSTTKDPRVSICREEPRCSVTAAPSSREPIARSPP